MRWWDYFVGRFSKGLVPQRGHFETFAVSSKRSPQKGQAFVGPAVFSSLFLGSSTTAYFSIAALLEADDRATLLLLDPSEERLLLLDHRVEGPELPKPNLLP
jgi:hypothetical protein